MARRAQK